MLRTTLVVILIVLASGLSSLGWLYARGRDLRSLSDGLSSGFRRAGVDAVGSARVDELDAAVGRARKMVLTDRDAKVLETLASYQRWLEEARLEAADAKKELANYHSHSDGNPKYAADLGPGTMRLAQLRAENAQRFLTYAGDCRQELLRIFPYPEKGQASIEALPTKTGSCFQWTLNLSHHQ